MRALRYVPDPVAQICDIFVATLGFDEAVRLALRLREQVTGSYDYHETAAAVVNRLSRIDQDRFKEVARGLK